MADPFDLERFVRAQEGIHEAALTELRAGRKRTHWMWFVFPQIAGLGGSPMARRYAVASLDEARAYLGHSQLGPRLAQCAEALLGVEGRTAHEILGYPDDLKLRSCATLFAAVAPPGSPFERVLATYFGGRRDSETLRRIEGADPPR